MANDRQTYRKAAAKSASLERKRQQRSAESSHGRKGAPASGLASSFATRFMSSKIAILIVVAIVALLAVGMFDSVANSGKAFGNVSINGQSVAGKDATQIRSFLESEYAQKIQQKTVRIFASDEAVAREQSENARRESVAQAEQISVEDARSATTSWTASATDLRATVPYDQVIEEAMAAGRGGGPLERIALFVMPKDIDFTIGFDEKAVEDLAGAIDNALGDERIDATVAVEDGVANAVKGHDGKMVDREWLTQHIADALLSDDAEPSFVAEISDAPSRTTIEQAQQMSASINKALNAGLNFTYRTQHWAPDAADIGSWTRVKVAQVEGGWDLKVGIDTSAATSDLVKHLDASVTSNEVAVDFEVEDGQINVKTSGSGIIPEVGPAVERIGEILYGPNGLAWSNGATADPSIQVNESDAPEQLTLDQAIDMGIVMVIGQYTTEFSDAEGTENRNHNIQVAADLLNNSIADSNGGQWSFNDHSGDTNQDPPFASAGSIVNGEYVDSIGGGICQVATTVFNAVYEAGLDIVERKNHSLYIESYPTGRDAAVSYPEMDFVWANPLKSDVLLQLSYTNTSVTAKLFSTPTGYKVSTETGEWQEGEHYKTEFESDDTVGEGSYYLKTTGTDGSQIEITRTVTDINGAVVKQDTFASIYSPKNEVYIVGPGTDTGRLVRSADSESEESSYDEWVHDESGYSDDREEESLDSEGDYLDGETSESLGYDEEY